MKYFIVWDKISEEFADNICLDAELLQDGISYSLEVKEELFELFYPIGLTDINGKSIYIDSSICKVNYFSSSDWISDYCYFSFDTENLRYIVHLINEKEIVDYESSYFDCFEIIDTIQENKLGLIK